MTRCYPGSDQSRRWSCRRVVRPASAGQGISSSSFATVATQRATFHLCTPNTRNKGLQRSCVSPCSRTPSATPWRNLRQRAQASFHEQRTSSRRPLWTTSTTDCRWPRAAPTREGRHSPQRSALAAKTGCYLGHVQAHFVHARAERCARCDGSSIGTTQLPEITFSASTLSGQGKSTKSMSTTSASLKRNTACQVPETRAHRGGRGQLQFRARQVPCTREEPLRRWASREPCDRKRDHDRIWP